MKVAIIGAGTSGLSCAIELEKFGIKPIIFERNDFIGEYHPHVSAFLNLIARPINDPVKFIAKQFGIKLNPLHPLEKIRHYSPNNQVDVVGRLGYFMIRGRENNSVKNQLRQMVQSEIKFSSFVKPEDVEKEFDYVVVADGQWQTPERFGIWREVLRSWVKGGIFEGQFQEDTLELWLDNELTRGVYIYGAPYSKKRAVIAHVVQGIEQQELNSYWTEFLKSRNILRKYDLIETWELPHRAGLLTTNRVRNIFFVGAAGGGAEPFLGFGQFNAVYQGVMTARSIVTGKHIDVLLKDLNAKALQLTTLRPLLNAATNHHYDILLSVMKMPGYRALVYNTNFDIVKLLSSIVNPFVKLPVKRG